MDFKKLTGAFGGGALLLIAAGLIMMFAAYGDLIVSLKPAVSFQDMLDGKEVKVGSHVAGDVVYVLDYFASESTYTRRSDGSRSGDRANGNYYLIPTEEGVIGFKSRQADVADMDKLIDETYDFLAGGTEPSTKIFIQGTVEVMEDELARYYEEYLTDMGYTQGEIEAMGEPLIIQYRSFTSVRVVFLIGLVMAALGVFLTIRRYKRG